MKCLSKTILRHKQEQVEAERRKQREEKLAKMTPEEREAYEADCHEKAVNALSTLAAMNALTGRYYG